MENQSTHKTGTQEEIDLGIFLTLLIKLGKKMAAAIRAFFLFLYRLFISLILLIRKRLVWLILAGLAGLSWGVYSYFNTGAIYSSEMVVRTNFGSAYSLYNHITNINALIKQNRLKELSVLLSLPEKEVAQLRDMDISAIKDDIQKTNVYRDFFLKNAGNTNFTLDTMLLHSIKYEDFIKGLSDFDFPLQRIRIHTNSAELPTAVQAGIIKGAYTDFLLAERNAYDSSVLLQKQILSDAVSNLDSLQQAYKKRIVLSGNQNGSMPQGVILTENSLKTPELDVYTRLFSAKNELANLTEQAVRNKEIIHIVSPLGTTGEKISFFRQSFTKYTGWALLLAFSIILLIEAVRFLYKIKLPE